MRYFDNLFNEEDIKKQYKKMAKKLHPDAGGSEEAFKDLLKQYEEALKGENTKEANNFKIDKETLDIIIALSRFDDLDILLVGSWVWIDGNTYATKEVLKELKCKWASKRKKWYWHKEEDGVKRSFKGSFEELRARHGSAKVTAAGYQRIA